MSPLRDVMLLLVIVLPMCGMAFVGYLYSPMHKEVKSIARLHAQQELIGNYYCDMAPNNYDVIEKYNFTDEEINPRDIILRLK